MAWLADWGGEQRAKTQHRENGSDGQQQGRNKSKHQRQPRHKLRQTCEQIQIFRYHHQLSEQGESEEAVRARVSAAWTKWRYLSGVISDKKMSRKLKIKLYVTVIRPVLLYNVGPFERRKNRFSSRENRDWSSYQYIHITIHSHAPNDDVKTIVQLHVTLTHGIPDVQQNVSVLPTRNTVITHNKNTTPNILSPQIIAIL